MDLIYMNADKEDVGVLLDYELDMAFGTDENNFECKIVSASHCCGAGFYLYIEGTEYGGVIDSIRSKSDTKEVVYSGRTWHGVLNSKVLQPDSGKAYLTVTGEANSVLGRLIERMGLSDLFEASAEDSGVTISNYAMNRYICGYDGIKKMLKTAGAKLRVKFVGGKVILSAKAVYDYSKDEEFDSDQVDFDIIKRYKTVNHLICLGAGELENRTVLHLYADAEGNISHTQTQFGADEYAAVYDYANAESEEQLEADGIEKLNELWETDGLSINFDANAEAYDVGDIVGAVDNITGITVSTDIVKKIVTIQNGRTTISYEVGE